MDLFGRGYVLDHCMSTLDFLNKEEAYRNYITDALRYIVNNTAGQEQRTQLKASYMDIINPKSREDDIKDVQEAEKKSEEIINHIKDLFK